MFITHLLSNTAFTSVYTIIDRQASKLYCLLVEDPAGLSQPSARMSLLTCGILEKPD